MYFSSDFKLFSEIKIFFCYFLIVSEMSTFLSEDILIVRGPIPFGGSAFRYLKRALNRPLSFGTTISVVPITSKLFKSSFL